MSYQFSRWPSNRCSLEMVSMERVRIWMTWSAVLYPKSRAASVLIIPRPIFVGLVRIAIRF